VLQNVLKGRKALFCFSNPHVQCPWKKEGSESLRAIIEATTSSRIDGNGQGARRDRERQLFIRSAVLSPGIVVAYAGSDQSCAGTSFRRWQFLTIQTFRPTLIGYRTANVVLFCCETLLTFFTLTGRPFPATPTCHQPRSAGVGPSSWATVVDQVRAGCEVSTLLFGKYDTDYKFLL